MTAQDVLTPDQAAALLQLPKRTVMELCRRGELGARKLGRRWRIPRKGIEQVFADTVAPVTAA